MALRFLRDLAVEIIFTGLALTSATILLGSEPAPADAASLVLRIVTHLVIAATLVFAVTRAAVSGPALGAALFLAFAGSWIVGGGIETALLDGRTFRTLLRPMLFGSAAAVVVTAVVLMTMGRTSRSAKVRRLWTPARFVAGLPWVVPLALAFAVVMTLAGLLLRPMMAPAYSHLPSLATMAAVELARGLVFVLSALPLLFLMAGRRWKNGLALGLLFALAGTLAPLLRFVGSVSVGTLAAQATVASLAAFALGAALVRLVLRPLPEASAAEQPAPSAV